MYGTQAMTSTPFTTGVFENDVKMYGTQAIALNNDTRAMFENDVKMYGTQARNVMKSA